MVNSGYTPRHSAAAALKAARGSGARPSPRPRGRNAGRGVSRVQVAIISATALALLGIVTYFATRAEPTAVRTSRARTSCWKRVRARRDRPLSSPPSVRVYRGGAVRLHGPSAVTAGAGVWVTNVLGNTVTRIPAGQGEPLTLPAGYGFDGPNALAIGDGHVWIANVPANSITEVNEASGAARPAIFHRI